MSAALDTLIASARDPQSRGDAIRSLVDLFVATDGPANPREKTLFGDIVDRVIDEYSYEFRQDLARTLAPSARTPESLARRLAADEIGVARPILEQSPVLTDDVLIEITESRGNDHQLAIASRRALSEQVTDALIDNGNVPVLRKVASNEGAEISPHGIATMVDKADGDEEVYGNLERRKNLSGETAQTLEDKVSELLLDRLRDVQDNASIQSLTSVAIARIESEVKREKRARLSRKVMVAEIKRGEKTLDDVVSELCPNGRVDEISLILADIAELPENLVAGIMRGKDPAPLMIVSRYLEIGHEAFTALTQAYCDRKGLSLGYVRKLLTQYSMITAADARRAITLIKLRERAIAA